VGVIKKVVGAVGDKEGERGSVRGRVMMCRWRWGWWVWGGGVV